MKKLLFLPARLLLVFTLLFTTAFSYAQPKAHAEPSFVIDIAKYPNAQAIAEILEEKQIQAMLEQRLGTHYEKFMANLENIASPAHMKNGDILISGWHGNPSTEGPAFVITAEGDLHAAYIEPDLNLVHYFSNNEKDYFMHPARTIWLIPYHETGFNGIILSDKNVPMIPWQLEGSSIHRYSTFNQCGMPLQEMQEAYRKIAADIWNEQLANS